MTKTNSRIMKELKTWMPIRTDLIPMLIGILIAFAIYFVFFVKPNIDASNLDLEGTKVQVLVQSRFSTLPLPEGDLTDAAIKMKALDGLDGLTIDNQAGVIKNRYAGEVRLYGEKGNVKVDYSNVPTAVCKSLKTIHCV